MGRALAVWWCRSAHERLHAARGGDIEPHPVAEPAMTDVCRRTEATHLGMRGAELERRAGARHELIRAPSVICSDVERARRERFLRLHPLGVTFQ
jgi:hypothetical protein